MRSSSDVHASLLLTDKALRASGEVFIAVCEEINALKARVEKVNKITEKWLLGLEDGGGNKIVQTMLNERASTLKLLEDLKVRVIKLDASKQNILSSEAVQSCKSELVLLKEELSTIEDQEKKVVEGNIDACMKYCDVSLTEYDAVVQGFDKLSDLVDECSSNFDGIAAAVNEKATELGLSIPRTTQASANTSVSVSKSPASIWSAETKSVAEDKSKKPKPTNGQGGGCCTIL